MTINFLAWTKKLRHPKKASCGGGEITAEEWRSAATLMRRRGSNPPAPTTSSRLEPPAGPPDLDQERFWPASQRHQLLAIAEGMEARAELLAIAEGMEARADTQRADAVVLRQIDESLVGFVAAEQGSIPATTDNGQILVTPPKPQPTGGRLIRGDVDMGFVPPRTTAASLLEMVREALGGPQDEEPKAAVLAVARWFRDGGNSAYAALLERQADV